MSRRTLAVVVALGTVYVVWGSTYLAIALAIETLPPLAIGGVRFLVAGAVLYGAARLVEARRGDPPPAPGGRQWLVALVAGTLLLGLGNGGVIVAQKTVPSGIAALVIATIPLWIAVLDRLFFGQRLSRAALAGVAIGFGGVALLVNPGGASDVDPLGGGILIVAAFSWAIGTLYAREARVTVSPLVAAGMQMLCAGAVLSIAAAATGQFGEVRLEAVSGRSLVAFAYLVVLGSIVTFTAYAWLVRATRTSLVATYAYVNPVIAILLGRLVLEEPVGARTLVAGAVILASVVLIVSAPRAPARVPGRSTLPGRLRTAGRSRAAAVLRGRSPLHPRPRAVRAPAVPTRRRSPGRTSRGRWRTEAVEGRGPASAPGPSA
jgi:drug/metabolite transporter (DMT)-like permease